MTRLAEMQCVPCKGGVPPLPAAEVKRLLAELGGGWEWVQEHHLGRTYKFPDFKAALAFVNRVGAMAEEQNHHPDITLAWGKARIEIWTHKINGLTESDFVFAARCDALSI